MSAICGIVDFSNKFLEEELSLEMMDEFKKYKFDKINRISDRNLFFGCGIQYITEESKLEVLPVYFGGNNFIITADAIIDNREELFDIFDIPKNQRNKVTDSQLIIYAYEKWGKEAPKYLVGDFAFAIWDTNNKTLFCARDHVGGRTLYYSFSKGKFCFSTTIKPLLSDQLKPIIDESWATDFLSLEGVQHQYDLENTVYEGIKQLPPFSTMIVSSKGIKIQQYWNPIKDVKPLVLGSDSEYEEAFRKVFFQAINCRLRSSDNVGIMISGGLDSASVAVVAAETLKAEHKELKAYCSVPIKAFVDEVPKYYVADEREYVDTIIKKVGNINVEYCSFENLNSMSDIDEFIKIFEHPYKIFQTLYWYNGILEEAKKNKCKVVLTGQFGNSTVSYGDFLEYSLTLIKKCKFLTLKKDIEVFSSKKGIEPKRVNKVLLKAAIPYNLRKFVSKKIRKRNVDMFATVPVNKALAQKYHMKKRLNKKYFNQNMVRYIDFYKSRKYAVDPLAFAHIGEIETKLSLAQGVALRDPTKDKRVIEFYLSLPYNQFVKAGSERSLIRRAMKGYLPEEIRLNESRRGKQSSDWLQRLDGEWEDIFQELKEDMLHDSVKPYIDVEKVNKIIKALEEDIEGKNNNNIRILLVTLIFSRFLIRFS